MTPVTANEVYDKCLRYVAFRKQFDRQTAEDQAVLQTYLNTLFRDWTQAVYRRQEQDANKRPLQ